MNVRLQVVLIRIGLPLLALGRGVRGASSACYRAVVAFLEQRLFPTVVGYATHPLVILATILLLVPLIIFAGVTALVLLGNTYLNVCSAAVSSIVLMQSLRHHRENKAMHAKHAEDIAQLHAKIDALTPPTGTRAARRPGGYLS